MVLLKLVASRNHHMNKITILVVAGLVLLSASAFAIKAPILAKVKDAKMFIGTWKLVGIVNQDGSPSLLFGKDPAGYIIYTKEGLVSAHLMRKMRTNFAAADVTCDEVKSLLKDYYGYSGTYKVDPRRKIVIHKIQIHCLPNEVGKLLEREYRFADKNHLYLTTLGATPNLTIVWERVRSGSRNKS